MTESRPPTTLHINLAAPRARLQGVLQRTIDLVSFGLTAGNSAALTDSGIHGAMPMPGVLMQFVAAQDRVMGHAQAQDEFVLWVLQCGFRDIVEGLQDFLEEVRVVCAALSLGPQFRVPAGWVTPFARDSAEGLAFHWKPFDRKLQVLIDEYNVGLGPELHAVALAINKARNCLAHRAGVVAAQDLNDPDGLRIRWRSMEFIVRDDATGAEQPLVLNQTVEGPSTVVVRIVAAEKLFRLGERVSVTAPEFNAVCITLAGVAEEVGKGIVRYGRSRGFPIGE